MCVDATDPLRGNWLRYVNWARSGQEQNLFPLEINRAIYYKVLKPIAPGEELLVWYNGEDNPEIAAAIEEERASSLSRKNSPRAKRARKKLLERAKQGGAEGFKGQQRSCEPEHAVTEMRESEDGPKEEDEKPSLASVQPSQQTASPAEPADVEQVPVKEETLLACVPEVLVEEEVEDEGEEEEEEEDLGKAPGDALPEDGGQASPRSEAVEAEEPPDAEASPQECEEEEQAEKLPPESPSGSPLSKLDPDPDGDPQESFLFPCLHCERRFTTKQGLERHMHIHISANCQTHTFKCRYCGKAFGSQINRRRHERRHEARPKKKPGSVSGTVSSFSPSLPTESSSPDLVSSSGNFIIIGAQNGSDLQEPPEAEKQSLAMETERSVVLDENGEPKEQHPCKYCKKVFGTHTNMRRHQRRIHERHLLPKGVRRKGMLPQEAPPQQPAAPPEESPNASPPPVYTPSGDPEDEGDPEEEYMVDISSNISENLSLYIDGKILSTSAVSTCEVIEVDPGSATLFGLDALIISPDKVTTALRVETASCAVKEVPNGGQATKRRTATPPLLPKIKTEVESELITPSSSASSSSASSTSSVVGGLYPQATETLAFPKEKTVYLSPKLKQLLQTQDSHKPGLTLFTEAHRLGPPLTSVTALPAASGRFKRRTASPPNSPQHSPAMRETGKTEAGASFGLKVPKLESHCSSPAWSLSSRDERETLSPQGVDAFKTSPVDWSAGRSGGSSCNQQPLDLSSGVNKRSEGSNKGAGEAVLDLSMHRKSSPEPEVKGGTAQSQVKKKKPNTSMLEKVLMNEYGGLEVAVEENPGVLGSASALSANDPSLAASPAAPSPVSEAPSPGSVVPTTLHPSPPSLTPVTMNPPSPSTSTLASPTPPPPVLPTAPSPLPAPTSPPPLPPSSPNPSSLPVLSPKNSPSPVSSSPRNPSPSPLDPSLGFVDSLPVVVNPDSGPVDPDVNPPEHSAKSAGPAPPADVSVSQVEIVPSKVDDSLMPSEELSLTSEDPSSTDCDSTVDLPNDPSSITETESSSPLLHLEHPVGLEPSPVTVEQNPMDPSVGEAAVPEQNVEPEEQQLALSPLAPPPLDPPVLVASVPNPPLSASSPHPVPPESPPPLALPPSPFSFAIKEETPEEDRPLEASAIPAADVSSPPPPAAAGDLQTSSDQEEPQQETFCKNFVCNVCDEPFPSIKELSRHIVGHAEEWPFKCEFCVQLFRDAEALLEHRSTLHGVGRIYVCSTCAKEFAFLCNLKQHQKDLHPGQDCMHTEVENGKLRPQNYTDPARASLEPSPSTTATETSAEGSTLSSQDNPEALKAEELEEEEEDDLDDSTEELYTTIKIMASGGGKPKGPDVRLGINQHYPSFKPPPFPYHNRTPAGSVASATNFTTHNIPQTFSTAIRCTKCGKSFDNMPELHKHILACANASDKKRYTPKKNPIPLKQIVKPQNGVLSAVMGTNASGQNAFRRMGQPKRLNFSQEPSAKMKLNALNKKKNQLVQKAISQKNKIAASAKKASSLVPEEQEMHICPHCNREFTYLGSLNKHVAVSCPRKPPSKKVKKGSSGSLSSQDKNGNLRRRTADSEIKQQGSQAKLGKTRARTSGPAAPAAVPSKPQSGKVKAAPAQAQAQARPKRPAPFPAAPVTYAKKSKPALKGSPQQQQQQQQQPPAPQLPAPSPAPSTHPTPRLAMRMQRGGKELPPKKAPEAKLPLPPQPSPPPPPQQQPKKEERFSVKTRERVGGPVTRSLQLVSSTAQAEGKTDDLSSLESREPQEHVLKLVK
ncbi:PRDM2 protein, partial [Atractosteus spatula]|nr:PRDM2 protein [Atractosteus spatula]